MDTYGLVGFPLTHSFSAGFFNQKFEAEGIDAQYLNFDIPDISYIPKMLKEHPTLRGFNVTRPYKELIIPYLHAQDKQSKGVGAVNAVKVTGDIASGDYKLTGYNSDVYGFTESIKPLLQPWHTKALILGSGGAAKAVKYALIQLGIKPLIVSRYAERGDLTYEQLTPEIIEENKLIVNATPVGQVPLVTEAPDILYNCLTSKHLCFDLIYNPEMTLFLKLAQANGAAIKNGLEMLLLQAQQSWEIWTK